MLLSNKYGLRSNIIITTLRYAYFKRKNPNCRYLRLIPVIQCHILHVGSSKSSMQRYMYFFMIVTESHFNGHSFFIWLSRPIKINHQSSAFVARWVWNLPVDSSTKTHYNGKGFYMYDSVMILFQYYCVLIALEETRWKQNSFITPHF